MIAFSVTYKCECEEVNATYRQTEHVPANCSAVEDQAMKFSSGAYKHQGAAQILNEMS